MKAKNRGTVGFTGYPLASRHLAQLVRCAPAVDFHPEVTQVVTRHGSFRGGLGFSTSLPLS